MVLYYAVLLVAKVFDVWVPSAPLLSHVAQGEIGGAVIDLSVYREHVGAAVAYLNIIGALQVERAEAQTKRGLHVAERSRGSDVVRREHHLVGESISYLERLHLGRVLTHHHSHLRGFRQVAQLVYAYPLARLSVSHGRESKGQRGHCVFELVCHNGLVVLLGK